MNAFQERLMLGGALRHVVACLPPEAARALTALAKAARHGTEEDRLEFLADLRREGLFNAGAAEGLDDGDAVALATFRYHLGRMTSAAHSCAEWLEGRWPELRASTRAAIAAETRQAVAEGRAGMPDDARAWTRLLEKVAPVPSLAP